MEKQDSVQETTRGVTQASARALATDALPRCAEPAGAEVVAAPASPAAAAAVVASAASSAPLSTAVTESASLALSAAPSSSAPLPFGSFLSTVRRSGLRILRTLDAPTLLRFAEQSLVLEEEVATGCLMIQGIALLEHFHKANGVSPLDWPDQATRTGEWAGDVRRERCSVTRHANRFSDLRPSPCARLLYALC
jgi:hypothetical protein